MTKINELHNKWMKNAGYSAAYEALEDEFALASAVIETRSRAGLTQNRKLIPRSKAKCWQQNRQQGRRWVISFEQGDKANNFVQLGIKR